MGGEEGRVPRLAGLACYRAKVFTVGVTLSVHHFGRSLSPFPLANTEFNFNSILFM